MQNSRAVMPTLKLSNPKRSCHYLCKNHWPLPLLRFQSHPSLRFLLAEVPTSAKWSTQLFYISCTILFIILSVICNVILCSEWNSWGHLYSWGRENSLWTQHKGRLVPSTDYNSVKEGISLTTFLHFLFQTWDFLLCRLGYFVSLDCCFS